MSISTVSLETRIERQLNMRETVARKHEDLLAQIEKRADNEMTETESEQIIAYREETLALDDSIAKDAAELESTRKAIEVARAVRRGIAGDSAGVEEQDGELVYRSFAQYAYDKIITQSGQECAKIAAQAGGEAAVLEARSRLSLVKRVDNTLSGDVQGLQPPQFIDQIFQVIDKSRPLVNAAPSTSLVRGKLNYPFVSQRPVVDVQDTEKTEAGNQGMVVTMEEITADTFLGGGDLSWQAINWSTPDALQLWFNLCAADYALKTEQSACGVVTSDAFANQVSDDFTVGAGAFEDLMTAIGEGYAEVFANSGRIANTVAMSPDAFGYLLGLTSTPMPIFISVNGQNIGPLNILTSRGMDQGTIIVGDMQGLLVAETAGAPVELRVVEPAIGGLEVGLIGAFAPVVVDPGSFSLISTAS